MGGVSALIREAQESPFVPLPRGDTERRPVNQEERSH